MTDRQTTVTEVEGEGETEDDDRAALRDLLTEYHGWMADHADAYDPGTELDADLESLERDPDSWAWVARAADGASDPPEGANSPERGDPAGCVLLYGETAELAEFKRLYVRPGHRGDGIGRELVAAVVDRARAEGFETLGLTTPPWSEAAHALYESMGFERTPPYPETRLPERHHDEAIFMQFDLTGDST